MQYFNLECFSVQVRTLFCPWQEWCLIKAYFSIPIKLLIFKYHKWITKLWNVSDFDRKPEIVLNWYNGFLHLLNTFFSKIISLSTCLSSCILNFYTWMGVNVLRLFWHHLCLWWMNFNNWALDHAIFLNLLVSHDVFSHCNLSVLGWCSEGVRR